MVFFYHFGISTSSRLLLCNHPDGKERPGYLTLIYFGCHPYVLWLLCSKVFPHGAIGLICSVLLWYFKIMLSSFVRNMLWIYKHMYPLTFRYCKGGTS